jgi:hypothetical protein
MAQSCAPGAENSKKGNYIINLSPLASEIVIYAGVQFLFKLSKKNGGSCDVTFHLKLD